MSGLGGNKGLGMEKEGTRTWEKTGVAGLSKVKCGAGAGGTFPFDLRGEREGSEIGRNALDNRTLRDSEPNAEKSNERG